MILATNRSGSFVMETLWSVANLKQRVSIVDELKPSEIQLKNDKYSFFFRFNFLPKFEELIKFLIFRFGRFLVNTIGLNFYKRKPDEWKSIQANELKKRKIFADFLDEQNDSSSLTADSSKNKKIKK